MRLTKNIITAFFLLLTVSFGFAQDDDAEDNGSVIQNLTPSKLIGKGQVDVKWFNNLYTQTRIANADGDVSSADRENFFTSTLDVFYGISENRRITVGAIIEFRSNTIGDRGAFDVFSFDGESGSARSGITSIAPSVKFVPFKSLSNFSVQSSLVIPTIKSEFDDGVFFDQDGFVFQNRFFYDLALGNSNKWQLFFDLNTEYNFGKELEFNSDGRSEGSFANDSFRLTPGVFLSYFPSSKFTAQVFVQHFQLIDLNNDFEQDLTAVGAGAKYQLTKSLNIEALWSYFARGNDSGLGESYNIGLRYVL
ncbi:hypothetical protein [Aquimarina sp. Aq107]|uniref:hypothetical protein n=1 Tax=Aquimarina sp. Aq107 TaxID=1191912 RepID=UPI000D55AF15|nr:hypothetical protein [Aquimarina sp. Aq107]